MIAALLGGVVVLLLAAWAWRSFRARRSPSAEPTKTTPSPEPPRPPHTGAIQTEVPIVVVEPLGAGRSPGEHAGAPVEIVGVPPDESPTVVSLKAESGFSRHDEEPPPPHKFSDRASASVLDSQNGGPVQQRSEKPVVATEQGAVTIVTVGGSEPRTSDAPQSDSSDTASPSSSLGSKSPARNGDAPGVSETAAPNGEAESPAEEISRAPNSPEPAPTAQPRPAPPKIPKYRAPSSGSGKARPPAQRAPRVTNIATHPRLETKVMARVDRAGRFDFTILFARYPESPERLEIELDGERLLIQARDDDWYEAPRLSRLGGMLRHGFVSSGAQQSRSVWALSSGRNFFVFAHDGKLGWTNQSRLRLGVPQIVLCASGVRDAVLRHLAEACGAPLSEAPGGGAPPGWNVFGLLTPSVVVPTVAGDDDFNLLRPAPEIEICLDGGLWLRASEWLSGFPPVIRVSGNLPEGEPLYIDGVAATKTEAGDFVTAGSTTQGPHVVSCAGTTATYSITEAPRQWERSAGFVSSRGAVAGAFAQPSGDGAHTAVTTQMSHRILIGATPGEWFACPLRSGDTWRGLVPFQPVWALPPDPLHCDRDRTAIKAFGNQAVSRLAQPNGSAAKRSTVAVNRWCMAILDCRRKGLRLEQPECSELWEEYLAEARRLRRILRHDGRQ